MWRAIVHKVHARVPELRGLDPEAWYRRLYDSFGRADHWRLYADVEETLKGLRSRGLTLGIISNWSTRLRSIARETGLESLVDFIVVSSEVGVRKPDPRIFQVALDRAGAAPSEAVYVGDQVEDDVRGAERMGIRPVLIWRKPGSPAGVDAGMILPDLVGLAASLFMEGSA
jgi:putative hydrolase of the HAD superfamily